MTAAPAAATQPSPGTPPARRHPLAIPHFRNLWIGATISLLGDQFYLVALPWLVLQLTGSSLVLGTILMVAAIPRAALMLVGGAITDRISARRVLIGTATARTFFVGAVAILVWLRVIHLWHLYLLTFAFGVADAFTLPAGPALIPTLVEPHQLQPANALMQGAAVMTQMVGPAPAGLLIEFSGVASALFFDALSFLAVIVALFKVPDPPRAVHPTAARPSVLHSIAEGLRAVRNDSALLFLMVIFATLNFSIAGPVGIGLAALAKFRYGSAAIFGTFLSSFSAGMLGGMALGGMVKRPRKRGLQFIAMGALCGLELIGIGLFPKFAAVASLLAVMGLGVGFVNVQFTTWIQLRVERAILGRVMSVLMFSAVGLIPVSYAISGALAQWSLPVLFVAAGAILAITSAIALTAKAARELD
ncbi:MAG TPA: MFS transporter [Candidatus Acidoferrales bacterium]|nr:MFS transporter [Candidatus Acidoferrales bacterium]